MNKDSITRPDAEMLRWYVAVLRAVPIFVQEHFQTNSDGAHPDVEANIAVDVAGRKTNVFFRYPAVDLSQIENRLEERLALEEDWLEDEDEDGDEEDEDEDLFGLSHFDRRAMEGDLAHLASGVGGEPIITDPKLIEAQEVMYEAFGESDPARRIEMAKQAGCG